MQRLLYLFIFLLLFPASGNAESLELEIRVADEELHDVLSLAIHPPAALVDADQINHRWLKRFQQQLPELVSKILQPYGYFFSQTDSEVQKNGPDEYTLNLEVEPGTPMRITTIDLKISGSGAADAQIQKLYDNFPLKNGDILRQDYYEEGKAALRQEALNQGYLAAEYLQHQIRVNRQEKWTEIVLHLDTGERYQFGTTTFVESGDYPDRYLRRHLTWNKGDDFSYTRVGTTRLSLINTDLFANVLVSPKISSTDAVVPVEVNISPLPRYRLRPGIGFGTDTGGRVSLDYRVLNLFKKAHQLRGELFVAQREQGFDTTYIIPDLRRKDSRTLLRVGMDREDTETFLSRKVFVEGGYQRSFSQKLNGSLYTRYSSEYSLIATEETRTRMLLTGLRFTWQTIDDLLQPRQGTQFSLQLQGAEKSLLSDTTLLQLSGSILQLLPLPHDFFFFVRLEGGTTWQRDQFHDMPASLRFFAGGDNSVRGYAYKSLGPENSTGEVIGGQHLLVANLELEKKLSANWGIAAFYDIGNAFNDLNNYDLAQGAGLGVRYYSQIGTIALDLARQVGSVGENRYRIHFGVGFGW
ncbi:MAG: autotransporter assembly complex family protein [Thermodesulfobacteriota bacterium]|nr:autotransporter assembly complex family protein [Thermodesulfobacteriota bacterium]